MFLANKRAMYQQSRERVHEGQGGAHRERKSEGKNERDQDRQKRENTFFSILHGVPQCDGEYLCLLYDS